MLIKLTAVIHPLHHIVQICTVSVESLPIIQWSFG